MVFGLVVLLWGGYSVYSCSQAVSAPTPAAATPAAPTTPTIALGDVGVLRGLGNTPAVILFANRDDFDAVEKAAAAKDSDGYRMISLSKGVQVPSGTKARKVDSAFLGGIQVRVTEGPQSGFAGWTFKGSLQPQ
jgi:hypothetical protein